uniref:Uncharacterized protein n=1 Tax=Parascaris equorum TaxID=6256 RepID=A0A914RPB1_PAREQ
MFQLEFSFYNSEFKCFRTGHIEAFGGFFSVLFASRRFASFLDDSLITAEQRLLRSVEIAAILTKVNRLDLAGRTLPFVYLYHIDCLFLIVLFVLIVSV